MSQRASKLYLRPKQISEPLKIFLIVMEACWNSGSRGMVFLGSLSHKECYSHASNFREQTLRVHEQKGNQAKRIHALTKMVGDLYSSSACLWIIHHTLPSCSKASQFSHQLPVVAHRWNKCHRPCLLWMRKSSSLEINRYAWGHKSREHQSSRLNPGLLIPSPGSCHYTAETGTKQFTSLKTRLPRLYNIKPLKFQHFWVKFFVL